MSAPDRDPSVLPTGLRERLAPFEATLRAAPVSPRGFKLTATLPVGG